MPTAAGWIVGVIATLSLVASISPIVRSAIRVPREFVNDYIFNFPDTSFAWAVVLALLAAALAARKSIAWWILVLYMVAAVGGEHRRPASPATSRCWTEIGEIIGLVFHLAAIGFLVLARHEFWAKVRRGALFKAVGALLAGMALGIGIGWGLLELFPGSLAARVPAWATPSTGWWRFAGVDAAVFDGQHPGVPDQRAARPVRRAGAGGRGHRAVPIPAGHQRAHRARTSPPSAGCWNCSARTIRWATSPPAATSRWCSRPTAAPRSPTASRSGVCLASGDPVGDPRSWPAAIDAWLKLCQVLRLGARRDGRQRALPHRRFAMRGLNAIELGDEAILHPDRFKLSGPDMKPVRQAVTAGRAAQALTVRIRRHRELTADEMAMVDRPRRRLARHRDRTWLLDGVGRARRPRRR